MLCTIVLLRTRSRTLCDHGQDLPLVPNQNHKSAIQKYQGSLSFLNHKGDNNTLVSEKKQGSKNWQMEILNLYLWWWALSHLMKQTLLLHVTNENLLLKQVLSGEQSSTTAFRTNIKFELYLSMLSQKINSCKPILKYGEMKDLLTGTKSFTVYFIHNGPFSFSVTKTGFDRMGW